MVHENWEQNLRKAVELRKQAHASRCAVQLEPLCEHTFGANGVRSLTPPPPSSSQVSPPTCSVTLNFGDGNSLVIAGCATGLFVGFKGKELQLCVQLSLFTQCAVLQEFGLVVVLAGHALIACESSLHSVLLAPSINTLLCRLPRGPHPSSLPARFSTLQENLPSA